MSTEVGLENLKATGHLSVDGGIILKWILGFDIDIDLILI
jgi:hypothetical protein